MKIEYFAWKRLMAIAFGIVVVISVIGGVSFTSAEVWAAPGPGAASPAADASDQTNPSTAGKGYLDIDPVTFVLDDQNEIMDDFSGLVPTSGLLFGISSSDVFGAGATRMPGNPYNDAKPGNYDGRAKGFVSPVTNQQNTELCWDFSTISAIESFMLLKGSTAPEYYSQSNAAYALSNKVSRLGFVRSITDPGNFKMAMAYMTRWEGPVLYTKDPFDPQMGGRTAEQNKMPAALQVLGYQEIPDNFDEVKDAVMKYGGVISAVYMGGLEYNKSTAAHYNSSASQIPNHQILIIGWDNNYPSANFNTDPGMNGAWIIKNSWGADFGDKGYMYVSYKDADIGKCAYSITDVEPAAKYDNLYLHDLFGQMAFITYNNSYAWYANIFKPNTADETLKAVSFSNVDGKASYQIYYGKTLDDKKLVAEGSVPNNGYYTIPLATPIALSSGPFAVFVKIHVSNGIAQIPIETNIPNYVTTSTSSAGESFVSSDGTKWVDITSVLSDANVCVRALTASK